MPELVVSANGRFLTYADGRPFFYLGDTAWELFHRTTRQEADLYLSNRASKGFTAIQAVVLAEEEGLTEPNAYGELPLFSRDPTRPNEAYFAYVDDVVHKANEYGLFVAMLPTWGRWVANAPWAPPQPDEPIFTVENARVYGRYLGERYRNAQLIWVLGGDRPAAGVEPIWRAMAQGLAEGDGGEHLMTYHPYGASSSSTWLHDEPWLSFNMIQSGHARRAMANYRMITADYAREPVKPVLDGEPRYEDHPVNWQPGNGWFDDLEVRQAAYWALFAGACGHTYGCHSIWQFWAPPRQPVSHARTHWTAALDLPGAYDMRHAKALLLSRPYLTRIPDQSLADDPGEATNRVQATRDGTLGQADATYIMAYLSMLRGVTVDTRPIRSARLRLWWYDPREGVALPLGTIANTGSYSARPPSTGPDWVLVIDDASAGYPAPGASCWAEEDR
ncbi:MAG: glycoside hydrolase family 140 protein [Anaerolineales bacterium]